MRCILFYLDVTLDFTRSQVPTIRIEIEKYAKRSKTVQSLRQQHALHFSCFTGTRLPRYSIFQQDEQHHNDEVFSMDH